VVHALKCLAEVLVSIAAVFCSEIGAGKRPPKSGFRCVAKLLYLLHVIAATSHRSELVMCLFVKYKDKDHPACVKANKLASREIRKARKDFERKLATDIKFDNKSFFCICKK